MGGAFALALAMGVLSPLFLFTNALRIMWAAQSGSLGCGVNKAPGLRAFTSYFEPEDTHSENKRNKNSNCSCSCSVV